MMEQDSTINLYSFLFVLALFAMGAVAHWAKKRIFKEVRGNFVSYWIAVHRARSTATGVSLLACAMTAAATGAADLVDPRLLWEIAITTGDIPAQTYYVIGTTFMAGFGIDSGLNKGDVAK